MDFPKISIVTAVYNQVTYLEETILSIVSQGYPNLEYVIIDGGSTDGTVDIIKKYESQLHYWVSEPDKGLYNALQKGFGKTTGEIMGWLGSDDLLHRRSLFVLADIFTTLPQINWLQGNPTVFNEEGATVMSYPANISPYDCYLRKYKSGVFIQQESTYWRRSLWEKAGAHISEEFKYAGDFELWMRFFQYEPLYGAGALIGGFRARSGQLSSTNFGDYLKECDLVVDRHLAQHHEPPNYKKLKYLEDKVYKFRGTRFAFDKYHKKLYDDNRFRVKYHYYDRKFYL